MLILFIFMYIFGFNIFGIIDSTIMVGILLSMNLFVNKKFSKKFLEQVFNKKFIIFIFLSFLLILWSILIATINYTFDYSYIKTYIHFIICIFIGVELLAYANYKNKLDKLVNYIIIVFCIQSIFQIIFYTFPQVSSLFDYFRSQSMIEISASYNGFRGIAITKSGFFSLSSAYAVVFVLFFSKYNTITKKTIINFLILLLLFIGTFFAGRTGFIGFIYSIGIKIISLICKNSIKFNLIKFLKLFIIIIITIITFFSLSKIEKIEKLYSYVFEAFYNMSKGSGFSTSSSDILIDMYDVELSAPTIIGGDGQYYEIIGNFKRYYKKTDVGYLRKILYFGIFGLILSIIIQINLLGNNLEKREKITLFLLLMILELKGEIIGLNIMVNSIVILYSLYTVNKKEG